MHALREYAEAMKARARAAEEERRVAEAHEAESLSRERRSYWLAWAIVAATVIPAGIQIVDRLLKP